MVECTGTYNKREIWGDWSITLLGQTGSFSLTVRLKIISFDGMYREITMRRLVMMKIESGSCS
jgi:hypothetical protein